MKDAPSMPGKPVLLAHAIGCAAGEACMVLFWAPTGFYFMVWVLPFYLIASVFGLLCLTLPVAAVLWRLGKDRQLCWTVPAMLAASAAWFAFFWGILFQGRLGSGAAVPLFFLLLLPALVHGAVTGERLARLPRAGDEEAGGSPETPARSRLGGQGRS